MDDTGLGIPPRDRAEEGILWYIQSGRLSSGDRLSSERELAETIGVSRTALRGAIAQLVSKRVLESRRGSGTYVCPPKLINIFQETYNFSDAARAAGLEPASRLIFARNAEVDAELAPKIDVPVGTPLFEMQRVRLAGGLPVSLETAYVNRTLCPGIEEHDFCTESLYEVLRNEYGVRVEHGTERLSITRVTAEETSLLQIEEASPAFFVRALERSSDMTPVEYVKSIINPGRFRFVSSGEKSGVSAKVGATWLRS